VAGGEAPDALAAMFAGGSDFDGWFARWRGAAPLDGRVPGMRATNPVLIPRNHRIEQAIQRAYGGDFEPFHRLADALATPYAARAEYADLEAPPRPDEVVHETSCGT
jgi:uncharacterized protein YdiU (UPF0061 family)